MKRVPLFCGTIRTPDQPSAGRYAAIGVAIGLFGTFSRSVQAAVMSPTAQAAVRHAHHGGGGGLLSVDPGTALFTLVIFIVLISVLGKIAWRPLLKGLESRENAIRDSIHAAAEAQAQVEQTRKRLEEKIAEVQQQAALSLQQAKADAAKAAELIHQRAEAESKAIKDQALRDIQTAKEQALLEIAASAADISVSIAGRILEREINVSDRQRLLDESLGQLGTIRR